MDYSTAWEFVSHLLGLMGLAIWFASNLMIVFGDDATVNRGNTVKMSSIPVILLAILFYLWGTI